MANIQEVKVLLGGMDRENSPETMNVYDYIEAHNIRTIGLEESDANYLSNLEGNSLITTNLPLGQNRAIGSNSFETVSKAYFVRFNSAGYHQIVEFNFKSLSETVVFENLTDSGGVDILKLDANGYFSDVRLVHNKYLILNNGVNPIYTINVDSFKDGRGTTVFKEEDILLAKEPSLTPPTFEYLSDNQRTSNALKGELFQFRTQFEYADFRSSSWSTVSKRIVPIDEPADGQGQNVVVYNVLKVKVSLGSDRVESLNIAVRTGLNNWLLVKNVRREYILSLPNTDITIGVNTEAYDPTTNEYIFLFYNDGLYPIIDQVEVESLYDHIPLKAETVEVINGNILAIGGLTEGYERPVVDPILTVSEYSPNISATITGGTDFDFAFERAPNSTYREWHFSGTPKAGDEVWFKIKSKISSVWNSFKYTVTSGDETNGLVQTIISARNSLHAQSSYLNPLFIGQLLSGSKNGYIYTVPISPIVGFDISFYVVRQDIGSLSTQSINTLKTNSSYQTALFYYDKFGKAFPVITGDKFIVNTRSLAETQGNLPQINWTLPENAPRDAVSYQWGISENQKYLNSIYLTGIYDDSESDDNYLAIEVKSLERFLENEKDSQINYTFTKGDKVVFYYTTSGSNNTPIDWFRFPFIELDIVSFSIEEDTSVSPATTKYILKVRKTSLIERSGSMTYLENKDILMEIYTPKKRDIDSESIVFYEIGEQFPIVDGKHSVLSGSIREGDWYFRGRLFESNVTANTPIVYLVEDPNFSDNYESKFWSAGRARTYNDEQGRVERQGSIRYSDEFIIGTKYNGLGRFYSERLYGEVGGETTSKYGWIKKLQTRDNALVCIQEFKVGIIPIYISVIEDNTGQPIFADGGRIFGKVRYRTGNYGCGNAKESISVTRDGLIYFFDDNNCLPLRDSYSGLDVIDVNMTSYFIKYAQEAKDRGARFIGYYDNYNNEWNLTIEEVSGRVVTISFEESEITYKDAILPPSSDLTLIQPDNGTATLSGYNVTYTPDTDYVGQDNIVVQISGGGSKNIPLNVVAGDGVPDSFYFDNLINQQLSVVVMSNIISVSGTNMPSTISITNGEYSINGGAWTSVAGMVNPSSTVRIRHTTSPLNSANVTTTLNIGGVTGTFISGTIPSSVPSDAYLDVSAQAEINLNKILVHLTISNELTTDYSIPAVVEYISSGSPLLTPTKILSVPVGDTTSTTDMGVSVNFTNDYLQRGSLSVNLSTLMDGSLIVCADSVTRIVRIDPDIEILS